MQHIPVNHRGAERIRAEAKILGIENLSFGRPFMGRIIVGVPENDDVERLRACLDPSEVAREVSPPKMD